MSTTVEFSLELNRPDAVEFADICKRATTSSYRTSFWDGCGMKDAGSCRTCRGLIKPIIAFLENLPESERQEFTNAASTTEIPSKTGLADVVRFTFTKPLGASWESTAEKLDYHQTQPPSADVFAPLTTRASG